METDLSSVLHDTDTQNGTAARKLREIDERDLDDLDNDDLDRDRSRARNNTSTIRDRSPVAAAATTASGRPATPPNDHYGSAPSRRGAMSPESRHSRVRTPYERPADRKASGDGTASAGRHDSSLGPYDIGYGANKFSQGRRDPNVPSRRECRVYVGNLSYDVGWVDLRDFMSKVGTVVYTDILTIAGGRSKGCGVVEYATPEEANSAIRQLCDTPLMGRSVFVREDREAEVKAASGPPRAPASSRGPVEVTGRQIFVANLPYIVAWQDLKDLFRSAGSVVRADIMEGADRRSKGVGTVVFETPAEAAQAICSRFARWAFDGWLLDSDGGAGAGAGLGLAGRSRRWRRVEGVGASHDGDGAQAGSSEGRLVIRGTDCRWMPHHSCVGCTKTKPRHASYRAAAANASAGAPSVTARALDPSPPAAPRPSRPRSLAFKCDRYTSGGGPPPRSGPPPMSSGYGGRGGYDRPPPPMSSGYGGRGGYDRPPPPPRDPYGGGYGYGAPYDPRYYDYYRGYGDYPAPTSSRYPPASAYPDGRGSPERGAAYPTDPRGGYGGPDSRGAYGGGSSRPYR
ncbi:hypothetical protein BDK51DRAFT_37530 [Blyttiomyces helicus]|uniref:RRM domain-containing protein n=1 Tax=Blyttiomyces helicus TaxID=388810 RepID=A0A4P9WJ96_9FUNG|nr:hypothetical protein BDK51DRAFT_37530 [Blyttiomyces helicus]|eukprot:RKO91210.1 hypothetical protein BDK51DRAFT_37530 [Blyttiomyces helicus]